MTSQRQRRAFLVATCVFLAVGLAGVVAPVAEQVPVASAQSSSFGTGGEFHALTPARIFDTRSGAAGNDVSPMGRKSVAPGGSSFDVTILGRGGIPNDPNQVLAAVVNVTVADTDRDGFLSIRPAGAPACQPAPCEASSLVNFGPNHDVPNLAVLGIGAGGKATVTMTSTSPQGGSANVIIDVFGWISKTGYVDASDSGSRFVAVGPHRILDTRSGPVPAGWGSGQMVGQQQQLTLPVRGAGGIVPNHPNVTGVMVNITAVNDGGQITYISATPEATPPGTEPATSITNLLPGQIKANNAIIPVGSDGNIRLFNSRGATHLIVDVVGYLEKGVDPGQDRGRIIPLSAPFRALDTRQDAFGRQPLGFESIEDWSFDAFTNSVTLNSQALGPQAALIGNLTATGLSRIYPWWPVETFLTVFPGGQGLPNSSNVNVTEGATVPNMSLVRYGPDEVIQVYNYDGALHYILDVYAVVLQ